MNKTIHELNSLSQAQADDEFIIYDVSEGESKKIRVQDLNNPNYSTTEQKTGGTWIDGKPIYRKVVENNTVSASSWQILISSGFESVDTMIKICGILYTNDNYIISLPWAETNYTIGVRYNTTDKKIYIKMESNAFYNRPYKLVFEYTKTTD